MIEAALVASIVVCANCTYAAVALETAERYRLALRLTKGIGFATLSAGTALEVLASVVRPHPMPAEIVMLGAVVVAAACDAACGYVFDSITLTCLTLGFVFAVISHALLAFILGVAAAGGSLTLLYAITRGRGLGLGDVKLACCIGGGVGAATAMQALGMAFVLGGAAGVYLIATKRARGGDELRFAPYLAAGTIAMMLRGTFS